ncbi:MAG: matrixin family metalloprotease [Ignavibacteriaceae bacterium]
MKKIFVITFMFLFLFDSNIFAQSNCYTPPNAWYRRVTQPVFKWHWDGQLNGAVFDGYDHVLSTSEKQTIVRNAIIWAVNYWKVVVNSHGTVIEDMSEDKTGNGNFHFTFTSLTDQLGNTVLSWNEIQLAKNINITWTDNYTYASANRAYDIKTVILHEIGHVFLGAGHSTWSSDDPSSLMWEHYTVPFRSITQCDIQALLNLYPLFNITVDNNFTDNTDNDTHGKVRISGYSGDQTAPITINKSLGQSVTLSAISPQTNNLNYQMIWNSGTTNTSEWQRNGERFRLDQSFTLTVSENDNGASVVLVMN